MLQLMKYKIFQLTLYLKTILTKEVTDLLFVMHAVCERLKGSVSVSVRKSSWTWSLLYHSKKQKLYWERQFYRHGYETNYANCESLLENLVHSLFVLVRFRSMCHIVT